VIFHCSMQFWSRQHLNLLESWMEQWKITVNPAKSSQIAFTTRRTICPQVSINNFPHSYETRRILNTRAKGNQCLVIALDGKLLCNEHTSSSSVGALHRPQLPQRSHTPSVKVHSMCQASENTRAEWCMWCLVSIAWWLLVRHDAYMSLAANTWRWP
jgi:hypothetical protein